MAKIFDGKVAIVTGGGRGIGRAECLLFAQEGAKVVVNDFGGEADGTGAAKGPADEVVAEIKKMGGEAVANYEDVSSFQGAERLIKQALDTYGQLDILINNAGILRDRMVFNMTEEEWDRVMAVHLKGHFNCTKFACLYWRERWKREQKGGCIVNTSSEAGLGNMGQANYSAAKEGIVGLTRTVALDMGRYGVRVNCIRPRAATRLTVTPELKAAMEKARAAGIPGPIEEAGFDITALDPAGVAPIVAWLCTDAAANVNGRTFLACTGTVGLYSEPVIIRSIHKEGNFTLDELSKLMPTVTAGLVNPAPPRL